MYKNNKNIYEWKYTPTKEKQDPYEDIIPLLQELSTNYNQKTEQEQEDILNKMIAEIRKINVFPVYYFNEEGISKEIQSVIQKKDICIIDDTVFTQLRNGLLLLDFLFPNLHLAYTCNIKTNMYSRFYDDNVLKICLKKYLQQEPKINNLRTVYFKSGRFYWDTPINFSPMRAKIIAEHFCPSGGTIYDYSAGYGGRMLGILCSDKNFTYIATDPNTNTYYNLQKLGKYIEKETKRKNSYKLYNLCSEQLQLPKDSIDFCFSCPPFFNKEYYSEENTQSINKYPQYNDWLEFYVRKTIKNCYIALKETGVYAVDICDYFYSGKKIPLTEDWIRIAKEEGFYFKKQMPIKSRFRTKNVEENKEFIYLFTKKDIELPNYTEDILLKQSILSAEKRSKKSYRRSHVTICQYNINGELEKTFNDYDEINIDKSILKLKDCYNNKYYRIYYGDDIIKTNIDVKQPICFTKGKYYFTLSDAAKALNVSKQAVSQNKIKNNAQVNGVPIIWIKQGEKINIEE